MDYARRQRDPTRHLIGLTFVILFHALLVYGLMTGLARKAVEVIKQPITAVIIPEVKPPPPPPPPPKIVQAPPKVQAPPPPTYVPPPDVPPPSPPPEAPVITAVAPTPPPEPYVIAPPPPVVIEAPPAPPAPPTPKPAVRSAAKVCSVREEIGFPRQAIRQGIQKGRVLARLSIDERGNVLDVSIVSADPPRHFDRAVIDGLSNWKCQAEGSRYVAEVEVNFTLKD